MNWILFPASEFSAYKDTWDNLNRHYDEIAILSSDFIEPAIKHFGSGKELLALSGSKDDPVAMGVLIQDKTGRWATFQPSQAPLGCWLQAPGYSTRELMQSLMKELPGVCLTLSLTQQDPDLLARPDDGVRLECMDYIETAWIDVNGDFEDYWSQRSKNTRQNIRRQNNRLDREEVARRLEIVTNSDTLQQCISEYGKLESSGWKSDTNTAIHIDNQQGKFYLEVLENFYKKDKGLVFRYFYDDQLVATDLCIQDQKRLIFLKTTYDESIRTSSPAMQMHKEAFEYVFANKLAEKIEFYGKVMEWHTKLSQQSRMLYHVSLYSKTGAAAKKALNLVGRN